MTAYIERQAKAIKSMPKIQGKLALREDPEGKALASLCQILAGSNPFLYVD
jgi:hypothetical protein